MEFIVNVTITALVELIVNVTITASMEFVVNVTTQRRWSEVKRGAGLGRVQRAGSRRAGVESREPDNREQGPLSMIRA